MTPSDVLSSAESECFQCGITFSSRGADEKVLSVCVGIAVIEINNPRVGRVAPMAFCSSDCMVYDASQRYNDRIRRKVFRKQITTEYSSNKQIPTRWASEESELVCGA